MAGRLVPEHQGRRPARVVPVIGVHVRAADADSLDLQQHFACLEDRHGLVLQLHAFGPV